MILGGLSLISGSMQRSIQQQVQWNSADSDYIQESSNLVSAIITPCSLSSFILQSMTSFLFGPAFFLAFLH